MHWTGKAGFRYREKEKERLENVVATISACFDFKPL